MLKIFAKVPLLALSPGIIAGLVAVAISILSSQLGLFSRTQHIVQFFQTIQASRPASGEVAIVAIDSEALARYGGCPIGRQHFAAVLSNLHDASVERLYLDKAVATPANSAYDELFRNALADFGKERVALPTTIVRGGASEREKAFGKEIAPIAMFAEEASLVSTDCKYDPDGRIRSIGRTVLGHAAKRPTAGEWLCHGGDARSGVRELDFRIDLKTVPTVSFCDVADGNPAELAKLKGKKVVLSVLADNVVQAIATPRYGELQRAHFLALAGETAVKASSPKPCSMWWVIGFCIVWACVLGVVLPRLGIVWGGCFTILAILLLYCGTVSIFKQSNYFVDTLIPFTTCLFSYIACLIATDPSFAKTRQIGLSFINKVDFGLARLFHSGVDAIVTFTPEGNLLTVNAAAENLFGIKAEDVIGRPLTLVLPDVAEQLLASAAIKKPGRIEAVVAGAAGKSQHVDLAYNAMPSERGWVGYASIRDISQLKARESELEHQAMHDAMTGLPNRLSFEKNLDATLRFASETGREFAVFLIDLNRFKQVNDRLGHHVGDALLKEVARRFSDSVRQSDTVARLGGDEFAVITSPPTSEDDCVRIAAKMVETIASLEEVKGQVIDTGASVGISFYPRHAATAADLVRFADEAMYIAKREHLGFHVAGASREPSLT